MISSHPLIAGMDRLSHQFSSLSNLDTSSHITEVSRSPVFTTVAYSPSFTQVNPHISQLVTRANSLRSQPVACHSVSLSPLVNPLHQSGTGYSLSALVRPSLNPLVNSSVACRSSLVNSYSDHSQLVNSSTANQLVNSSATSQSPSLVDSSAACRSPLVNSSPGHSQLVSSSTANELVNSSATSQSPSLVNSSAACRSSLVNSSPGHSQLLVSSSTANQLFNSLATSQSPLLVNSTATGHPSCLLVNSSADGCSMLVNADRLVFSTAVDQSSVLINSLNQSVPHSSLVNSDYSPSNPLHGHQSAASNSLFDSSAVSRLINTSTIGNSSSSLFNSLAAGHPPTVFVNVLHQPITSHSLIETTHPISSAGTSNSHSFTESTCSASSHQPTAASTVSQCDTLTELKNAVAGGNLLSIGKAILKNKQLADVVIKLIAGVVDSECSVLCRRNNASFFRKTSVTTMSTFKWSQLIDELSLHAPTLFCLLSTIVSHSDHRNQLKVASAHQPGLCMSMAVLLKERNREMCGVQSIISMLLYQSHVEKQVCVTNVLLF